jgi:hypothetical protein
LCFGWSNKSSFFSFFVLLAYFFLGAMSPTTYITTLYMCFFGVICVYANWTPQLNFITIHLWRERPLEEKSEQETSHVDPPPPPHSLFGFQCPCFKIQTCDQNPICRDIYIYIYIYKVGDFIIFFVAGLKEGFLVLLTLWWGQARSWRSSIVL